MTKLIRPNVETAIRPRPMSQLHLSHSANFEYFIIEIARDLFQIINLRWQLAKNFEWPEVTFKNSTNTHCLEKDVRCSISPLGLGYVG